MEWTSKDERHMVHEESEQPGLSRMTFCPYVFIVVELDYIFGTDSKRHLRDAIYLSMFSVAALKECKSNLNISHYMRERSAYMIGLL